jgi:hypothetical protein
VTAKPKTMIGTKPKTKGSKKAAPPIRAANELKRAGAQVAGSRRTDAFRDKWTRAMAVIRQEIVDNKGIYPQNEGRINLAEVARRSGAIVNSLYPARHRDLKTDVEVFIDQMLELAPTKEQNDKPPEPTWEELYRALATNYQADVLLWRSDLAKREAAEKRVAELEQTVALHLQNIDRLTQKLAELTRGHVVPIRPKKVD